jgi:hypothetical protein
MSRATKPRPNCPRIHPRQLHSVRGILTLLILNTCQSGEKATAPFFGKGGLPQSGFRAIMAKQPTVLSDEIMPPLALVRAGIEALLAIIRACGERTSRRFIEFFTARNRSPNCRQTTFGSSLAADLMLIRVFAVVDVAIPFDDDFALLAVLA